MNVLQLFTTVDGPAVVARFNQLFSAYPIDLERYTQFVTSLRQLVPIQTNGVIEIDHFKHEFDDSSDNDEMINITTAIEGEKEPCSISFMPRNEVIAKEVQCNVHFPFDLVDQAAYLLDEITDCGWDEETSTALFDKIKDAKEDIERGLAKTILFDPSSENFWGGLFSDCSLEERQAIEKEAWRCVENYKTKKTYKNGQLVTDGDH